MIAFGICQLPLIPIRNESSEKSELLSQLLFGETCDILDTHENWSLVRTHFDNYKGWIASKMITKISAEEFESYKVYPHEILKIPVSQAVHHYKTIFLPGGSTLALNSQLSYSRVEWPEHKPELFLENSHADIAGTAITYLNAPYLWGGRSVFGIDCSGFTQIVYKMNGKAIPRDAYQQAQKGETTSIELVHPGDLAFFKNENGRITHTGIILTTSTIIHALGHVRIDKIDEHGIFNTDTQKYTHSLAIIKRLM